MIMSSRSIGACFAALVLSIGGPLSAQKAAPSLSTDNTTSAAKTATTTPDGSHLLRLDWVLHGLTSPFQLGLVSQAYKAEGVDLRIEDGKGPAATVAEVASKGAAFGLVDGATLVRAVTKGAPVKAVMSIMAISPLGVVVRGDANIQSVSDLRGKRVAATTDEPGIALLQAILKAQGIAVGSGPDKVEIVGMDGVQKLVAVAEGRAHALVGGAENHAVVLALRGIPANTLTFAEAGWPMVGLVIITHTDTIRDKPQLVRGFVRATQQAYAAATRDPNAAVLALPKLSPGPEREFPLQRLKAALPLLRSSTTATAATPAAADPFGTMTAAQWAATMAALDIIAPGSANKKSPGPAALFTNEFVAP
jgi:NitT/TauT family transport system substrate-binding protein